MININTQAFDEIVYCAVSQGFIKTMKLDGSIWISLSDWLKIKDLEW